MKSKVFIFDLDDTLYKEVDFLKSAYREIASIIGHQEAFEYMLNCFSNGKNAFSNVIERYNLTYTIRQLLKIYRNHKPNISLEKDTIFTLDSLNDRGIKMCLLTDGRSVTQRNKIDALGLYRWFADEDILISEEFGYGKPSDECYEFFKERYHDVSYTVIGDNPTKDFVTPNRFGWSTICLIDDGRNIHKQDLKIEKEYLPKFRINNINQIIQYYV